eukprot:c23393_g1_i1 orf=431-2110(+)
MAESCCGPTFWLYILIIVGLVLFAGMMSGLTLGLMSLGLVDLEVLINSGTPRDQKYAAKILPVVKNQHLLLCTLLVGNALAMEALPIFLDALVTAWGAILISVTLILLFGEILPQAVCSRYGLAVGAAMTPVVRVLVFLFFPVTYPISKLLDFLLGKGHVALFRRAELQTLVNMHGNEAGKGGELTHDETTIIAGALKLHTKTAKDAMTSISSTFSIDVNARLDMNTMNLIMMKGHSRIPVYSGTHTNIIGLILVKNLLTTRPEEEMPVRQHATIRKIPRVEENMPLYDILNEFQKGHSHMAAVVRYSQEKLDAINRSKDVNGQTEKSIGSSKHKRTMEKKAVQGPPMAVALDISEAEDLSSTGKVVLLKRNSMAGPAVSLSKKDNEGGSENRSQRNKKWERTGQGDLLDIVEESIPSFPQDEEVIGIITMEDVIEELLQEEILDETDGYIDVHNKIKVNMLPPGGRSPQGGRSPLSPISSSVSSFQHTPALTSPVSSFQHTPTADSPLSSHLQAPQTTPVIDISPNSSFPQSPPTTSVNANVQTVHDGRSIYLSEQGR